MLLIVEMVDHDHLIAVRHIFIAGTPLMTIIMVMMEVV